MCDLCEGSRTSVPSFARSRSRSMPASSTSTAENMRAAARSTTRSSAATAFMSSAASISRSMPRARAVMTSRSLHALAGHVGDDLLQLGAADDLLAQPVGRLADGAEDGAPLALEAPQQRVRQAPHEHVVARAVALAREKLAQVDRLAGAQRRVAAVGEKLRDRAHLAGPLRGAEDGVDGARACAAPRCATRRTPAGRAGCAARSAAARRAARACRWSPSIRPRPLPSSRCGGRLRKSAALAARGHGALEVRRVALGRARAQRVEPAAPHRLEDPQAEVVREADWGGEWRLVR